MAGNFLHGFLKTLNQFFEICNGELGIQENALLLFHVLHDLLERINIFLRSGFHAKHHIAEHLHETAV